LELEVVSGLDELEIADDLEVVLWSGKYEFVADFS
jgi:hypothetical protein